MLKISRIKIENFLSCQNTELILEEFTPLVGYNNAGKSNILRAIESFVRCKALGEAEFHDTDKPVVITALISGLSQDIIESLTSKQEKDITPFIKNEEVWIRLHQTKPGSGKQLLSLAAKSSLLEEEWTTLASLNQIIATLLPEPTFIRSMEDSAEDVAKIKATNTIGKLILILQKEILRTKSDEISDALEIIGKKLNVDGDERLEELSIFDQEISAKVQDFFPGIHLSIDIPTPKLSDLFKTGNIKITEQSNTQVRRDFSGIGHGAQRAIQMTLIRHLAEIGRGEAQSLKTNILLIDEPELFLHPQAIEKIRASLKALSKIGYQVIFSTHSPFMIENDGIVNTNIVRKDVNGTHVKRRLKEALTEAIENHDAQARILFDTFNLSQILFSDKVLIAEGETEKQVLPSLFYAFTGRTPGESKLAIIIANGSKNLAGMRKILELMEIPCLMLVDLDYAFVNAHKHGFIDEEDITRKTCLSILKKIQPVYGFALQGDYPTRNNDFKASDIYEILAKEEEAQQHIVSIHEKFKSCGIWLWHMGAIEPHLCIVSKESGEWYRFKERLTQEPCYEVVEDAYHIRSFIEWIERS